MVFDETDDRFCVKPSSIAGVGDGMFTKAFLDQGERLEVIGVLIPSGSIADRCTRYADRYKFRVGKLLLIPLGYGGMVNHSTRPNLEKIVEGEKVYLQAIRPIEPGEELFFTYGESYFEATKIEPGSFAD